MHNNTLNELDAEAIFSALQSSAPEDRQAVLERLCGGNMAMRAEVESLLAAADEAGAFLSVSPVAAPLDDAPRVPCEPGQAIGPYRIVREIGRGGMGTVYLAERADGEFDQLVALKIVSARDGANLIANRFKDERQILASLQHANIARLLDGGTTRDGLPYLVMEYVDGEPIDIHCRSRALSLVERLELFVAVCAAVEHAHRKLIVHRDLKPGNIFVTAEGTPKLLDFGIAKLLAPSGRVDVSQSVTALAGPLMTPEYASPEQMAGEPTGAATDVYSLGVVLYELLTGRRPVPDELSGTVNADTGQSPVVPPSALPTPWRSRLRRDLDHIVLKALHPDPACRYRWASELATDLERYLAGRAVSAVKNTLRYRCVKFLQRHRAATGLAVTVVCGLLTAAWQWQVAGAERERAEQNEVEVRELTNTIVFSLVNQLNRVPGSMPLREVLLDKGLDHLDRLAQKTDDDPNLMRELASAYHKLGDIQGHPLRQNLGDRKSARESYVKAQKIRERLLAQHPKNVRAAVEAARGYETLSVMEGDAGNLDRAQDMAQRCIDALRPHLAKNRNNIRGNLFGCYVTAAHWSSSQGDYRRARKRLAEARKLNPKTFKRDLRSMRIRGRLRLARMFEAQAELSAGIGDHERALQHDRRRLQILLTLPDVPRSASHVADAYQAVGARLRAVNEPMQALESFRQSLSIWQDASMQFPSDVRPQQRIAGLNAELASVHIRLANDAGEQGVQALHANQACHYSEVSQSTLAALPDPDIGFGPRFSWLNPPAEFYDPLQRFCSSRSAPSDAVSVLPAKTFGPVPEPVVTLSSPRSAGPVKTPEPVRAGPMKTAARPDSRDVDLPEPEPDRSCGSASVFPGAQLPAVPGGAGTSALLAVGDLDSDGLPDTVLAPSDADALSVLMGKPDGTFMPSPSIALKRRPASIRIADLNGDGAPDLLAVHPKLGVSYSAGYGDGTFVAPKRVGIKALTDAILVDVNGDETLDLVAVRGAMNDVVVSMYLAGKGFAPTFRMAVGKAPVAVTAGDVDRDGNLDLLTVNAESADVSLLFGAENGAFVQGDSLTLGTKISASACSLAVVDVTGDGLLDITVTHDGSGAQTILPGNGDGTFEPARRPRNAREEHYLSAQSGAPPTGSI
ncbi:MAG: protein kinase domain-containing protein [Gammaproteobacteria bacterium]